MKQPLFFTLGHDFTPVSSQVSSVGNKNGKVQDVKTDTDNTDDDNNTHTHTNTFWSQFNADTTSTNNSIIVPVLNPRSAMAINAMKGSAALR